MTPDPPPSLAEGPAATQEPKKSSVGWQLVQIAALAAMLLAGMYVVDLDAKALAEKRARTAFLAAVKAAAEPVPSASATAELEVASEYYAKVCAQCAPVERCGEAIRSIREARMAPAGRGPCKTAIFDRGRSEETPRAPLAH